MSPYLAVVLALVGSYLLGSVSFAVIVGRAKGVDILNEGSGNPGMSNVARTLGRGAAAITLIGDLMKGVVASSLHLFVDPLFTGPGDELLQGLAEVGLGRLRAATLRRVETQGAPRTLEQPRDARAAHQVAEAVAHEHGRDVLQATEVARRADRVEQAHGRALGAADTEEASLLMGPG